MDITLGQFFPEDSVIHKLDPRTKIISLFILMIVIFCAEGAAAYVFLSAVTCAVIFISKIPPITILKSLKPIILIVAFTFIIHLFTHNGEVLTELGTFKITYEGVKFGVLISLRLILLIVLSSLLTFTTSPIQLTDALEKLMSPLKKSAYRLTNLQ